MSDAHFRRERLEEALLPPVVALAIALVAGDLLILAYGEAPGAVWRLMLDGTWGNAYGIGQVLYKATTLTCTGLAVAVALRAGLFNIGGEGQLAAGGFGAAIAGLALPAGTPTASSSRVAGSAAPTVIGALPERTSGCGAKPNTGNVARSGAVLNTENFIAPVKLR